MVFFKKVTLFYHFKPIVTLDLIVKIVFTIFEKENVDEQLYVITKSIKNVPNNGILVSMLYL